MSVDAGLALKVAQCFVLIGKIRTEALTALEGDHEVQQKAPEAAVKLMAAHAQHLRGIGGDLIVPSNLGRHLSFGQYCERAPSGLEGVGAALAIILSPMEQTPNPSL